MTPPRKRIGLFILLGVVCAFVWADLYGPLFAWSPIKPGYEHLRFTRADIFIGSGTSLDAALRPIDEYIGATEQFHELKLHHRMTIIVCRDWSDFHRFMPAVRGEGVGAVTPEFGTVIYLTPRIRQMNFDAGEFLRHELSHAVLHQNAKFWDRLKFKDAPWLVEGLAVLSANQKAYGTWDSFIQRAREEDLTPFYESHVQGTPGFDIRFAYQTWRYFLEWTIETQGRAEFQEFLTRFLQRPTEAEVVFRETYGEDLLLSVRRFESAVRAGEWHSMTK